MKATRAPLALVLIAGLACGKPLTLAEAKETALRNHPRLHSAGYSAQASDFQIKQARSAFYPTVSGALTGAGALHDSVVGAGAITTSSLSSRFGSGVAVSQLVTDFGRTGNLVETAKLKAAAEGKSTAFTREQVLWEVEQAYLESLGQSAAFKTAQATVENRRLTLRQVRALAQSSLKSTLDVSFAEVAVSAAELELFRAENGVAASMARLSTALGLEKGESFELVDEPLPPPLAPNVDELIGQAIKDRPDLAALTLRRDAAVRFAEAERRLSYPTISMVGVGGGIPAQAGTLRETYAAAGVNVTIPVLNGGLFAARRSEAELRARAASEDVKDQANLVARDVRMAWLEANNAFRRLDVTSRLVLQANEALRLAKTRYDLGLGSIVELNQAQLSQMSAEIGAATAKYEYLSRRAALDYAMGALR